MGIIEKIAQRILGIADIDDFSTIERGSYIGRYSIVVKSHIGRFCSIRSNVIIGLDDHYMYTVSSHPFLIYKKYGIISNNYNQTELNNRYGKKDPKIRNDVWSGSDINILRGVEIGDGAVIGANATVTANVSPYAIVVG